MADLASIQAEFMALLLDNDRDIEQRVLPQGNLSQAQRLDIYRNGYLARLRSTIDSDHEILGLYLGDELFEQMVEDYVQAHPSRFWTLRQFADSLPDFLAGHATFSQYPILAEIARFERVLLAAFDAADLAPLQLEQLQQVPPESWPNLQFTLHPSLHFYQTDWNSVESWHQLKQQQSPPPAEQSAQPGMWAVWRNPQKLTEYRSIDAHYHHLLLALSEQKTFAEICALASEFLPEETVAQTIQEQLVMWIQDGWLVKAIW